MTEDRDWRYIRCEKGHKALLAWNPVNEEFLVICEDCKTASSLDEIRRLQ